MRLPHWTFALFLGLLHCAPLCRAAVKYSLDTSNVLGASMRYLMSDSRNNDTCSQDLEALEEALMKREMWALQMFDASSKMQSGILTGNTIELGNYDECVSATSASTINNRTIRGRHCMATVDIVLSPEAPALSLTSSICVPSSCDAAHVTSLLNSTVEKYKSYIGMNIIHVTNSTSCSKVEDRPWTLGEIITTSVMCAIFAFLVFCTFCELLLTDNSDGDFNRNPLRGFSKYSLFCNFKRIMSLESGSQTLPAIQGIRFLSITWVVLGHSYFTQGASFINNFKIYVEWIISWEALYILIAPFAVDTFFVLSGFLTCYLFLKEVRKDTRFNIFMYYIHRYVRLTPALLAVLLFVMYISPRMGSGPMWEQYVASSEKCFERWWAILLYVQNFVHNDNLCLGHSWYLAVDMQLFWVSPVILYPLAKKPKLGLFIWFIFFVASFAIPATIVAVNKLPGGLIEQNIPVNLTLRGFKEIYVKTYARAAPWLMGVFLGYLITQKKHYKPCLTLQLIGWAYTILALIFCISTNREFQSRDHKYNVVWETIYAAIARPMWAAGICWILYASIQGFGGFVSRFLSLPIFYPFARLSYCLYLVHFILQQMKGSTIRTPKYFSQFDMLNYFIVDFVLSVAVAIVFSLLFEAPILILEKSLRGSRKDNSKESNGLNGQTQLPIVSRNGAYENKGFEQ